MTIRCKLPEDHNHIEMMFPRHHEGGYIEDPDVIAQQKLQASIRFVVFVLLAVFCAGFIVHSMASVPHNIPVVQDYQVPQTTPCGKGYAAQWEDEFTITCMKETR